MQTLTEKACIILQTAKSSVKRNSDYALIMSQMIVDWYPEVLLRNDEFEIESFTPIYEEICTLRSSLGIPTTSRIRAPKPSLI